MPVHKIHAYCHSKAVGRTSILNGAAGVVCCVVISDALIGGTSDRGKATGDRLCKVKGASSCVSFETTGFIRLLISVAVRDRTAGIRFRYSGFLTAGCAAFSTASLCGAI